MKKVLLFFFALLTGVSGAWAGYYRPKQRVTTFDSDKMYMLYNTCIDGNQDRTGFIYVNDNGGMQKYTGTNRNPKQFTTTSTAYLWKVTTGESNHVSLQNVSNSKYYGYRLGQNDSDPNNLFLYQWGDLTSKQAGANSQNEDDPSQNTANANITFASNKVFIIGNGSDTFWNGNPGDIVTWSTGHPFAFYEVEEVYTVTYTITDPSGATLTGTYEGVENADPSFSGMGYTLTNKTWTKGEGLTATFTATLSFTDNLPFNVSNMSAGGTKNYYTIYGFGTARYWYRDGTAIKSESSVKNASFLWAICSAIENGVLGFKIYNVVSGNYVTGSTAGQNLTLGDGTLYVYAENTGLSGSGFRIYNTDNLISFTSSNVGTSLSIWTKSGTTHKGSNLTFTAATTYYVTATENLSEIDNYSSYNYFNVPDGTTLNIDVADFDLTKVYGAGTVVLKANTSLTNSKTTTATGKLAINEGYTLTIGTGDGQTNSIESFTSIELAGTIKHQNSAATLNNITVPTGKTGKIFAIDMGSADDAFKLAGTTTLNGNLTVLSKWNAQITVDELSGSGTWLICGTTGDDFDDTKTASTENAIIKVGSSPTFTGTIHEANTKSNLSIIGTLKNCTLKGTAAPDGYPQLADGAVLDGVILEGNKRIGTTGSVTIKDLAGNNLSGTSYNYAFIGSGTLNFEGTCDLTKKSDDSESTCSNIGYPSGNNIVIKSGSTVTAGKIYNTSNDNAAVTVEGTVSAETFGGVATLAESSTTTLSYETPFYGAVTVSGNATLNLTATVATIYATSPINVAEGKTLTIDGGSNTVNLQSAVSGSGNIVLSYFPTAATHPTVTDWTGTITFPSPASAQANLQAIFNAWGNENSTIKLHSVTGWLPDGNVNPTLEIMESETLTINNGSSSTTPVLKKITGAGNLEQTWTGGSNYTLKIATLTGFTGTLKGTNKPIVVEKIVLESAPYVNTRLIKTSGTVSLNTADPDGLYVGLQRTSAYTWETKTVDEVEGIYVTSIDQVQLCREMATNAVAPYFNHIGTGVGKYTIHLGLNNTYTSIEDFTEAVDAWTTTADYVNPTVTINQPTSAFYRIKSGSKYLQDVRKSDSETQRTLTDAERANEAAGTVFYLDNNTLIGYKTGYGFGFTVCQTQDTEHLNSMLFTESAEMGKYTIQSQQGTCASASYNEGYWGVDGSDLSRKDDAASGACWTLEAVDVLPVTITAAKWATLYSPVALTIQGGVTAYVISQKVGTTALHLEEITGIIPAGKGVILYADVSENSTYYFPITTESSEVTSLLTGVYATANRPANSFVLGNGSNGIGFYADGPLTVAGFKAYYQGEETDGAVKAYTFDFETAVKAIEAAKNPGKTVYDINGRRVQNPEKGLYIVNGKKVYIK